MFSNELSLHIITKFVLESVNIHYYHSQISTVLPIFFKMGTDVKKNPKKVMETNRAYIYMI
jgi:hypothetical protein